MQAGKMGVVVLIIALSATLLISWVMSMDVEQQEVTKYNPLADITGEFETERTPDYIRYNPSTNYTGYYTDDSIIDGDIYFDGVDYEPSNPNNFRLNLKPLDSDSGTKDLTTISEYSSDYRYVVYADYRDGRFYLKMNDNQNNSYGGHTISLADLIEDLNAGHDYDLIKLSSNDNNTLANNPYGQNTSVDWCVFSIKSEWHDYRGSYNYLDLASASAIANPTAAYQGLLTPVKLSAEVDLTTKQVKLYADNSFQQQIGIYTLDEVLISTAGGVPGPTNLNGYISFGTTINYVALDKPDPQYMDPSAGVELL